MKISHLLSIYSAILWLGVFFVADVTNAQTIEATCELHYRHKLIGEGVCTATQTDETVVVKGTVEENGQKYTAIITHRSLKFLSHS